MNRGFAGLFQRAHHGSLPAVDLPGITPHVVNAIGP